MKPQSRQHPPSSLSHSFPEWIPFPRSSILFVMLLIFRGQLTTQSPPLRLPFISNIPDGHVTSQARSEKCELTPRWRATAVRRRWISLQGGDDFSLLFYCPPVQSCDCGFYSGLSLCWRDVVCFLFSVVSFQSYKEPAFARHRPGLTGPHQYRLQALIKPLNCIYVHQVAFSCFISWTNPNIPVHWK